jgi:phosphoribosylglycinamide formyltransferase-1
MGEKFISESIKPVAGTFDTDGMSRGEPGLPDRFLWRKAEYKIAQVIDRWKDTGPCKSGSKEKYVRKHWFKIRTTSGEVMKIYFERKPLPKSQRKMRWWLYSIAEK